MSAETKPNSPKGKRKATKKVEVEADPRPEGEGMTYGPLVILHVDLSKQQVVVGVDRNKSNTTLEELQSEDAKTLAVRAASKSGMENPVLNGEPLISAWSATQGKITQYALGPKQQNDVVPCVVIELQSFGDTGTFIGDSVGL